MSVLATSRSLTNSLLRTSERSVCMESAALRAAKTIELRNKIAVDLLLASHDSLAGRVNIAT